MLANSYFSTFSGPVPISCSSSLVTFVNITVTLPTSLKSSLISSELTRYVSPGSVLTSPPNLHLNLPFPRLSNSSTPPTPLVLSLSASTLSKPVVVILPKRSSTEESTLNLSKEAGVKSVYKSSRAEEFQSVRFLVLPFLPFPSPPCLCPDPRSNSLFQLN